MAEVHEKAEEVLAFWFALDGEKQFAKDAALDAEIAARFGGLRDDVLMTGAAAWRDDPDALLAAIVLIDQFSRNIHRGTAEAFAGNGLAQDLAELAIDLGWDITYPADQRAFVYMPLMHAEDERLQALSVAKFEALGNADNLAFARDHAEVIERYGRFPSRNAALGRLSTPDEKDYLSRPDAGW